MILKAVTEASFSSFHGTEMSKAASTGVMLKLLFLHSTNEKVLVQRAKSLTFGGPSARHIPGGLYFEFEHST